MSRIVKKNECFKQIHLLCLAMLMACSKIARVLTTSPHEGIYTDLSDLHHESEIARHLVSSLAELLRNKNNFQELNQQANIRAQSEEDAANRIKNPNQTYFPDPYQTRTKTREEEEDENTVRESLVKLSVNRFKQVKTCGMCCACRNDLTVYMNGMLAPKTGTPHCSKLIILEIESILEKTMGKSAGPSAINSDSEVLNSLFGGLSHDSGFLSADIIKRIVSMPSTHSILKTYLIVLLDSILMDMCNSYKCDFCRALYSQEGFIVYRVVRAANVFTKGRDMNRLFGIDRIRNNLKTADEARGLLVSLDTVFTLIRLNTGIQSMVVNTFNRNFVNSDLKYTKVEEVCKILLHMLGLTIVLNSSDSSYYFMQPDAHLGNMKNKVFPIPNAYNMSTVVYDMLGETGINNENIINIISQYNTRQPSSAFIPQDAILNTLQMSGLPVHPQGQEQISLKVVQNIPLVQSRKVSFDPAPHQAPHQVSFPVSNVSAPVMKTAYINTAQQVNRPGQYQYAQPCQGIVGAPLQYPKQNMPMQKKIMKTQKTQKIRELADKIDSNNGACPTSSQKDKQVRFNVSGISQECPLQAAKTQQAQQFIPYQVSNEFIPWQGQPEKQFQVIGGEQRAFMPMRSHEMYSPPVVAYQPAQRRAAPVGMGNIQGGTPLSVDPQVTTYGFH